jgi:four helix bundle protein
MNKFKELTVWQKSMDLAEEVYKLTADFPKDEKFGLQSQIKRSVVSIASNIAEGAGRNSKNEFKHFLSIALGSSYELETQLTLAFRFNYINNNSLDSVSVRLFEVQKMIIGLSKSLN